MSWDSIFDLEQIKILHVKLRYHTVKDIKINYEDRSSEIIFDESIIKRDTSLTLIPKTLYIYNQNMNFSMKEIIKFENFPEIFKFFENHCPYIKEYLDDKKDLESFIIDYVQDVIDSNTTPVEIVDIIDKTKKTLKIKTNNHRKSLIALIQIIKMFYSEEKNSLETFKIKSINDRGFTVIIKQINTIMDTLSNPNLKEMLKVYKIQDNSVCVIKSYRNTYTNFKFADHNILRTVSFEPYANLNELKLLDYISNMTITGD
jgi:hypothetical protein